MGQGDESVRALACYSRRMRLSLAVLLTALPAGLSAGPVRGVAPSLSLSPARVLSAVAARYRIDPDPDALPDLGEGDHAQVRSGVLPVPAPAALAGRLPTAPGGLVAVKIPYVDPGGMAAREAAVSRRLEEAGGGEIFVRAVHDPELGVVLMERLDGYRPLDEWAEDRRRPISRRTYDRVAAQLERGLEVLEAAGLVHSDLKPGNVLVGPRGRVKIIDFGIAADVGGYPPYPGYEGRRGGDYQYVSESQLRNGPAALEDDRHAVDVLLGFRPRRAR